MTGKYQLGLKKAEIDDPNMTREKKKELNTIAML